MNPSPLTIAAEPHAPAKAALFPPPSARQFTAVVLTLYALLSFIKIVHHTLWRDEFQAWMLCRDSASLLDLWANLRLEGHPALWYLLFYPLSHLTRNPLAMQIGHWVVGVAAVYVVLRWAPFTRVQKALFAFGYFPFFEYATISRAYGMGLLLLMVACVLLSRPGRNGLAVAIVLVLLAHTSVCGAVLAIALALAGCWRALITERAMCMPRAGRCALLAGVFVAGLVASIVEMWPGPINFNTPWVQSSAGRRAFELVCDVWRSYLPIPRLSLHFWNTNAIDGAGALQFAAALVLLIVAGLLFLRRPMALVLWFAATAGLLLFFGLGLQGYLRHHGHLFLGLLAAYWLSCDGAPRIAGPAWMRELTGTWDGRRSRVMTFLLAVHAVVGIGVSAVELGVPFSASRAAAACIQERFPDLPVIGHRDYHVSPIAGYLDRPVYYATAEGFGTFVRWDGRNHRAVQTSELTGLVLRLFDQQRRDVVIVLGDGRHLPSDDFVITSPSDQSARGHITLVGTFTRSIVPDETYTIYLAHRLPERE